MNIFALRKMVFSAENIKTNIISKIHIFKKKVQSKHKRFLKVSNFLNRLAFLKARSCSKSLVINLPLRTGKSRAM
jgi:hypothetical protein